MIIKPLRDKKTKKIVTNVEVCKRMYGQITALYNGDGCKNDEEKEQSKLTAIKLCGGSANFEEVYNWLKQINDAPTHKRAQELIEQTLLPVVSTTR